MIGIALGLLAANAGEWLFHKHVLHGVGKNKRSFWSFHWHEHHRNSKRNDMRDATYERNTFGAHAQGKESAALVAAGVLMLPLLPIAPLFTTTMWACAWNYHRVHKRAHLDPAWAREHLPWHVDHHLAPNQDANWCVTNPFFDHVMDTRVRWVGTDAEKKASERAAQGRKARDEARRVVVLAPELTHAETASETRDSSPSASSPMIAG